MWRKVVFISTNGKVTYQSWKNVRKLKTTQCHLKQVCHLVPRVLSYRPYGARERERPWKTLVTCLPESVRLQTNDLGKGQVSVRFVSKERKQVSAAMKLCT